MRRYRSGLFVGVDACKGGWFTLSLDQSGQWEAAIFPSFECLWKDSWAAHLILVDMPIGLPETAEERQCDIEARKIIGKKRALSLFRLPVREAIYARSYREACRINRHRTAKAISRQMWNIIPRLKELDSFLQSNPQARKMVRETHPEVCFAILNGGRLQHPKKTSEGACERKLILHRFLPEIDEIVENCLARFSRGKVALDDLLDAAVAAVTARLGAVCGYVTIPGDPPRDSAGLPMEIVFTLPEMRLQYNQSKL